VPFQVIPDTHPAVEAFVKNAGLGFAIPYVHNGQTHDYQPDFIVRLKTAPASFLILEPKGFDELADVKAAAAERWVAAVNSDAQHGTWCYRQVRQVREVRPVLDAFGVDRRLGRGSLSLAPCPLPLLR
jgi:type III restriction enzyme